VEDHTADVVRLLVGVRGADVVATRVQFPLVKVHVEDAVPVSAVGTLT